MKRVLLSVAVCVVVAVISSMAVADNPEDLSPQLEQYRNPKIRNQVSLIKNFKVEDNCGNSLAACVDQCLEPLDELDNVPICDTRCRHGYNSCIAKADSEGYESEFVDTDDKDRTVENPYEETSLK